MSGPFDGMSEATAKRFPGVNFGGMAYIGPQVKIEPLTFIGAGVVLDGEVLIRSHTKIGVGCVIGCPGFAFTRDANGIPKRDPFVGLVDIRNAVEIGAFVTIDRGRVYATTIGDDVKIDSHVHIAHDVQVGARTLIAAHSCVGGHVKIGQECRIALNNTIRNRRVIGNKVMTGMHSAIVRDVPDGWQVAGRPARQVESLTEEGTE